MTIRLTENEVNAIKMSVLQLDSEADILERSYEICKKIEIKKQNRKILPAAIKNPAET